MSVAHDSWLNHHLPGTTQELNSFSSSAAQHAAALFPNQRLLRPHVGVLPHPRLQSSSRRTVEQKQIPRGVLLYPSGPHSFSWDMIDREFAVNIYNNNGPVTDDINNDLSSFSEANQTTAPESAPVSSACTCNIGISGPETSSAIAKP